MGAFLEFTRTLAVQTLESTSECRNSKHLPMFRRIRSHFIGSKGWPVQLLRALSECQGGSPRLVPVAPVPVAASGVPLTARFINSSGGPLAHFIMRLSRVAGLWYVFSQGTHRSGVFRAGCCLTLSPAHFPPLLGLSCSYGGVSTAQGAVGRARVAPLQLRLARLANYSGLLLHYGLSPDLEFRNCADRPGQ